MPDPIHNTSTVFISPANTTTQLDAIKTTVFISPVNTTSFIN